MSRPRPRLLVAGAAGFLVAGALIAGLALGNDPPVAEETRTRPELLLLTSLPIVFPEVFTLEGGGSPALAALERRYRVTPISAADSRSLDGNRLLLMAQPNAQTGEALVELDRWVRGGGHLLLLADPVLEWPSELPLGDIRRPASGFADTGLLGHWGLRLDSPDRRGPARFELGGMPVDSRSPGSLVATGQACAVESGGAVARCRIGKGRATIIADADFLNIESGREQARPGRLEALLGEIGRLER